MAFLKKKQTDAPAPPSGKNKSLVIAIDLNGGATDADVEKVKESVALIISKLTLNELVRLSKAVANDHKRNMALKFI